MRPTKSSDYVRDFVEEVLRTGITLSNLLADLIELLPEDAYPGESHAEVVLDMLIGTIRPVAEVAGERSVRSAAALLDSSRARTLSDLRRAAELAGRREDRAHEQRRSNGAA